MTANSVKSLVAIRLAGAMDVRVSKMGHTLPISVSSFKLYEFLD